MKTKYIHLAIILISSWFVYSHCQEDTLLHWLASGLLILTFFQRLKAPETHFALIEKIPLSVIIVSSFLAGLYWRGLFPAPEESLSPFPTVMAALQAGTIFAAIIIWLKPFSQKNLHHLFFLAWLTVTTSMNVPFNHHMFYSFSFFCMINMAVIILHTMHKSHHKKHRSQYYRQFIIFSILWINLTVGLFYVISKSMYAFDHFFMDFMSDYIVPRNYTNFLRLDPRLTLDYPGPSAWDKRPVLEITLPRGKGIYLKMQNFETFDNGSWMQSKNIPQNPIPNQSIDDIYRLPLTMFTTFDEVIPSPINVASAESNGQIFKSTEDILYAQDKARSRMLTLYTDGERATAFLTPEEHKAYLSLPENMKDALREISQKIVLNETDPQQITSLIQDYFHQNFGYSFYPDFRGTNKGILRMITERRAAYCSYFASAMTLLLRAQNIPSRVATGFLISSQIDAKKNKYLARVSDAHAWVEVFLPEPNALSNQTQYTWQIFDPTPSGGASAAIGRQGINFSKYREALFLSMLRFKVYVENMDQNKVKKNLLLLLALTFIGMNIKKMIQRTQRLWQRASKRQAHYQPTPNALRAIYKKYEDFLSQTYQERRRRFETDQDLYQRLIKRGDIPKETLHHIHRFLQQYHRVRFGQKSDEDLEQVLHQLIK